MKTEIISVKALSEIHNEPRILDTDLAERLGMIRETNIRSVIAANRDELETYGSLHVSNANPDGQGGRPGKAYWLNEGQALVICALSRTQKAAQVRKMLIDVFMAYRQGKIVHVKEHHRRPPCRAAESNFQGVNQILQAFRNQPEALIEVLARCVVRLDKIEREI